MDLPEMSFPDVVKEIVDVVFSELMENVSLTLHQLVLVSEETIRFTLSKHYDGLEEDFEVNVTGGVGKDMTFRINVEDVRRGMITETTLTYERYEEQEHPMQPTREESIDPTPITKAQRGRSERVIEVTRVSRDALEESFLESEGIFESAPGAASIVIKRRVIEELHKAFPEESFEVKAEVINNAVASLWVENNNGVKIRLRANRATQQV